MSDVKIRSSGAEYSDYVKFGAGGRCCVAAFESARECGGCGSEEFRRTTDYYRRNVRPREAITHLRRIALGVKGALCVIIAETYVGTKISTKALNCIVESDTTVVAQQESSCRAFGKIL